MSNVKRALRALGLLPLLLAAACATQGLPEAPSTSRVTASAIRRTNELYLYPDRLDRRVMTGALDALEARFDSVRFAAKEEGADHGTLSVGSDSAIVPLDAQLDPDRFDAVLARALLFTELRLGDEANQDEGSNLELVALRGALAALDPYSTVFSGRSTEDFQIRFSGKLHGIGARIGRRDGRLTAVQVFPKSPAAKAGLEGGDSILRIDGDPTRPLTVGEAVGQIRGMAGTPVTLSVLRGEDHLEIEIIRGEVVVPSVETRELAPGIGYARIMIVSRTTLKEFSTKVAELGPLQGLVLDVRGNSGGSMIAAAGLADLFLERGIIVRIVDRSGDGSSSQSRAIAQPGVLLNADVVILVDSSTASAAEILSGALAPLERVTIVGQTTFGKGLIQRVMPLPEQNLLKLTVGEYLLSDDRAIHKRGIDPDIPLYPVSTENLGRLADVPKGALPYLRKPGEDDTFPIDLAQALLEHGNREGLARTHDLAETEIREALEPFGIAWPGEKVPGADVAPLEVLVEAAPLVGGEVGSVAVEVHNPNEEPMLDVWAALQGPARYLRNRMVVFGTVPPESTVRRELELQPDAGLSVDSLGVQVLVAAGAQPLAKLDTALAIQQRPPRIQIDVVRVDAATVRVSLLNLGCCDPGQVRVALPGNVRSLDALPPGETSEVELTLAGDAKSVAILLSGAGVQRRIEVPLPEDRVTVLAPEIALERATFLGRERVQVHAQSADGLRQGWLALDGQKEIYVAWDGRADGHLRADLVDGAENVTTKIETVTGVSVIDSRLLPQ